MSVLQSDIVFYASANMPEDDTATSGGAIDTAVRVVFDDIDPSGNVQVVSSAAGDTTQTVTVSGRNAAGVLISEAKTLNGTTVVPMTANTTWERLLKAVKSATTTGDVAVEAVTAERANTATAGAAASASAMASIDLDAGASAVDDAYNVKVIRLTGGTGVGQIRRIVGYVGATKRAFVNRDWDTVPDATSVFKISDGMVFEKTPSEITTVRRVFYAAAANPGGGAAKDLHEKVFAKNVHGTLALTTAAVKEQADPSGLLTFGLAGTLNDTGSAANRLTAPGGVTFDNADKNVATGDLTAGDAQGVWIKLALAAGAAAQKTSYTPRVTGNTT